jgi:transposase
MARSASYEQDHLERAYSIRDNPANNRELRAAIIFITLATTNLTRKEITKIWGISEMTVSNDLKSIRVPEPKGEWGGGNNHLMSFEEEQAFLDSHLVEALQGKILTMTELHSLYSEKVGKDTPKSTFYRLLKRHNWRKVWPDTSPPKAEPQAQEKFNKKLLKKRWTKL